MEIVVLKDNFGAELDVLEDSSGQWRITQTHGKAVISLSGNAKKVKFEWGSFLLDPGETASLTMDLKLAKIPPAISTILPVTRSMISIPVECSNLDGRAKATADKHPMNARLSKFGCRVMLHPHFP